MKNLYFFLGITILISFASCQNDNDALGNNTLKSVRLPECSMVSKSYEDRRQENSVDTFTTILKLKRVGGIYEIPCKVNGHDLMFYFDTGASDVTLSLEAARELSDLGLLKTTDIIGKQLYRVADGEISEGLVIVLKEIKIDRITLKNVKASIVLGGNAPLLLGQTALEKLGKFSFDYSSNELTIFGHKEFDFLKNNKLNQNIKKNYFVYENSRLSDDGNYGRWIANDLVEVFDTLYGKKIIFKLKKKQKFYAIASEYHYYKIAHARIEEVLPNNFSECSNPPFRRGDLIYLLNPEGEGVWNVIHNDQLTQINCSYEPKKASLTESFYDGCNNISGTIIDDSEEFIYWVKIKTIDGIVGWIKNPNCYNVIGTRPNCYNNSSPAW